MRKSRFTEGADHHCHPNWRRFRLALTVGVVTLYRWERGMLGLVGRVDEQVTGLTLEVGAQAIDRG